MNSLLTYLRQNLVVKDLKNAIVGNVVHVREMKKCYIKELSMFSKTKLIFILIFSMVTIVFLAIYLFHDTELIYDYDCDVSKYQIGIEKSIIFKDEEISDRIIKIINGPKNINEIIIHGYHKPRRALNYGETIVVVNRNFYLIYLYFDSKENLFHVECNGS
jgi:hypothetical protein